jgi:hypothetical protein
MASRLVCPPWHTKNRIIGLKLAQKALLKKRGKAPLPQSKAAQRAIAAALAHRPAARIAPGRRALDRPGALSD